MTIPIRTARLYCHVCSFRTYSRKVTSNYAFGEEFTKIFPEKSEKGEVLEVVGVGCCAQFAVTAAKVQEKPRSEYVRIRDWIINTPLEDAVSGRIMEYSWHSTSSLLHLSLI
jgi:Protein of unknown function (DUF3431)